MLIDEVQRELNENHDIQNDKMLQQQIIDFIRSDQLSEAQNLLVEYRRLYQVDSQICSIEAVLLVKQGKFEQASLKLQDGLRKDAKNFDLLYNYAHLLESRGKYLLAASYYAKARDNANTYFIQDQVDEKLAELIAKDDFIDVEEANAVFDKPKVTVFIPTYNMEKYLKQAIDSILLQDYENIEIVVSDDGSTDGTAKMMTIYSQNSKVKYLRNTINEGNRANVRKLLYEHVDGKYFMGFCHDDYLIKSDYISNAVQIMEEHPDVSLVFANFKLLYVATGKMSEQKNNLENIISGTDYFLNYGRTEYPCIVGSVSSVFRRQSVLKTGGLLEKSSALDLLLNLKLMLQGNVGFISDCVGVYRIHTKSLSYNMPLEDDLSTIHEFVKLKDYAVTLGLSQKKMNKWLQEQVYDYVHWRFFKLWEVGQRRSALQLISQVPEHFQVCDTIMGSLVSLSGFCNNKDIDMFTTKIDQSEFYEIAKKFFCRIDGKKILIWGTGTVAATLLEVLRKVSFLISFKLIGFLDNDSEKWGNTYSGLPVFNPKSTELKECQTTDDFIIIVASQFFQEIINDVAKLDISRKYSIINGYELYILLLKYISSKGKEQLSNEVVIPQSVVEVLEKVLLERLE